MLCGLCFARCTDSILDEKDGTNHTAYFLCACNNNNLNSLKVDALLWRCDCVMCARALHDAVRALRITSQFATCHTAEHRSLAVAAAKVENVLWRTFFLHIFGCMCYIILLIRLRLLLLLWLQLGFRIPRVVVVNSCLPPNKQKKRGTFVNRSNTHTQLSFHPTYFPILFFWFPFVRCSRIPTSSTSVP